MIAAIETYYNGYRFRSRLEARWAVFFDAAGIRYEYEPNGYTSEDGTCYLPDFYLPGDNTHVEVKPNRPGFREEIRKALSCVGNGGIDRLLVLQDIPPQTDFDFYWYPLFYRHPLQDDGTIPVHGMVCFEPLTDDDGAYMPFLKLCTWTFVSMFPMTMLHGFNCEPIHDSRIMGALRLDEDGITIGEHIGDYLPIRNFYNGCYAKARTARFEHGENPGYA